MKDMLLVIDNLASVDDKYTTMREVLEIYYDEEIEKPYIKKDYGRLKQLLHRNKAVLEYKNGTDVTDGFRFKRGYENYFSHQKEKKLIKQKKGDERKIFLTGGLQMLLDRETATEPLIELECVNELQNLFLVKVLSKFLGRTVIEFYYLQGYENKKKVIIHPHLLKEYNSRWFLFGYVCQESNIWEIVNVALDRIVYDEENTSGIRVHTDIQFKKAPRNFYHHYFKDIVGVTRYDNEDLEDIRIRTVNYKVHHLLRTKPVHSSQMEISEFDFEKGYGEFTIKVIPNIELQTRLLSYGSGLYVVGGSTFLQKMRETISQMSILYNPE